MTYTLALDGFMGRLFFVLVAIGIYTTARWIGRNVCLIQVAVKSVKRRIAMGQVESSFRYFRIVLYFIADWRSLSFIVGSDGFGTLGYDLYLSVLVSHKPKLFW